MDMSGFREGFVEAGDVRLHYVSAGDPKGHPVIFVHGFPDFWYGWRHQLAGIGAMGFHAIAPDMTGYNLSDKPEGVARYRVKNLVEDLRAFAEVFAEGRPFTLAGHDFGGAVAWAFALKYPHLIDRLVIANAMHPGVFQREIATNPAQQETSQYMNDISAEGAEDAFAADNFARLSQSFADAQARGSLTADDMAAYRAAWSQPGALTAMFNWYRAMKVRVPQKGSEPGEAAAAARASTYDPSALVVKVPTLVIWGMNDHAILPVFVDGLPDFVTDLKVVRVDEGTHWVLQEFPELVTAEIGRFLAGDGGAAAAG